MHAAFALVLAAISSSAVAELPLRMVRISSDEPALLASRLGGLGFDIHGCGDAMRPGGVEFVASVDEIGFLEWRGFDVDVIDVGRPFTERRGEVPIGYPTLAEIEAQMQALAAGSPRLAQMVDLTQKYGTPPTHEGRHLYAVKISDNAEADEDEPAVLIVATHHAREIMNPVIALNAIDELLSGYGSDPQITELVNTNEIWIAPMWNPDGYHHVMTVDDFWRKNRRNNGDGTWGVDLNRNYPFGWAQCGGSQNTSGQTYEGPSAGSEPETQTMIAFAQDRRFAKVGDFHSYASEVRYGYGCWFHPWDGTFRSMAQSLSTASGYFGDTASSCCLGGDIHMHGAMTGAATFLWETGTSFQPSYSTALVEANKNWGGIRELIAMPLHLSGRVTDARTGEAVGATVELVGVGFQHGEAHGSSPRTGLYHSFPPNGIYQLRFDAEGYLPQQQAASYTGVPVVLDVALQPECVADLAEPFGQLTAGDISTFANAFNTGSAVADLAEPFGQLTFGDIAAFVAAFNGGCP
jgi:hypothetical protein